MASAAVSCIACPIVAIGWHASGTLPWWLRALCFSFDGRLEAAWGTIREVFISMINQGTAELDPKSIIIASVVLVFMATRKVCIDGIKVINSIRVIKSTSSVTIINSTPSLKQAQT